MKSYIFPMIVEPDEDRWYAHVPGMEEKGWASWGVTQDEAIRNINEVAQLSIEILLTDGEPIPECVTVSEQVVGAVSV